MPFVPSNLLSREYRSKVYPSEWVAMAYSLVLMAILVIFRDRVSGWIYYVGGHLAILTLMQLMVGAESRAGRFFRAFDMCVYVPAFFFMVCQLVHRVHPTDYDGTLISIDRSIGGIEVLRWMKSIETTLLTRVSKAAWIGYYPLALIPGIALYARASKRAFREAKLVFMLGWLVSYLGYFAAPARGPGYHEKETGVAQPVWDPATAKAKEWIQALDGEARHTFPSGHVIVAAITIFVCVRNRAWGASAIAVPVSLAVVWSTLYLRYHYLVDVLAGLLVAAGCIGLGVWWHRRGDPEAKAS